MALTAEILNKTLSHFIHYSAVCLSLSARQLRCYSDVCYCVITSETCNSKSKIKVLLKCCMKRIKV